MNIAANANKPKQDRTFLRSCEPCRTAKAKYHKSCVYAEAQPRPKRGKQTHTRVAEVEKKLDNIYALLQANRHPETTTATNGQVPSPVSSPEQDGGTQSPFVLHAHTQQANGPVPPSDCRGDLRRRLDVIDKNVLSMQEAEDLLRIYQEASQDYSFIYVDPATSLETLRWEKPFLMLSILVMASVRARPLQVLLEKELRELLASKVIVEGELSLDLLQGLLLYVAWYHFNFRPCRQQIYQLSQLAVSMVTDLEIGKPSKEHTGFILHPVRACLACKKDTAMPITSLSEAKRTFVGAWYLTSALSAVLRKPNGMAYTKYIEQCCLDLAETKEAPMDEHLIHYVRIQRLVEEVGTMFGYSDFVDEARLSPERIQLSVRAFVASLQEIGNSFSPAAAATASIQTAYNSTATYIHEVVLHIDVDKGEDPTIPHPRQGSLGNNLIHDALPPTPSTNSTSTSTSTPSLAHQAWLNSTTRTDLLLGCLDSVKTTLNFFVSLPLVTLERFTMLDLARLSYNLLLLGRLTLSGGPAFNSDVITQTANVIEYFDLFNAKFAQLVEMQNAPEPRRSIFWHFQRVFNNARAWFGAKMAQSAAAGLGRQGAGAAAGGGVGGGSGSGSVGERAKGAGKGTNYQLSPLSLLDPEEEETMCRRAKELGLEREPGEGEHDGVVVGRVGAGAAANTGAGAGATGLTPGASTMGSYGTPSVDMEGVLELQDGLWEEMMAAWPMSMDGNVLF